MFAFWFSSFAVALNVVVLLYTHRNVQTLKVRNAFIANPVMFANGYSLLPEYEAMVRSPRYWHLWTLNQWVRWSIRRISTGQQP